MKKRHIEVIVILLCVDQFLKYITDMTLPYHEEVPLISDWFYLMTAKNYGTAFGIVEGHMLSVLIITVLSLILLYSFYHHTKEDETLTIYGTLLMMAGLTGNFLDRIFLGCVRDFLGISMFGGDIILNIADFFLWVGLFLILWAQLQEIRRKQTDKQNV